MLDQGGKERDMPLKLLPSLLLIAAFPLAGCWPEDGGNRVQGWDASQREAWYFATQGSRLMPRAWFDALADARTGQPFATVESLARYGFLPPPGQGGR